MTTIAFIASILALVYGVVLYQKVLRAPRSTDKANIFYLRANFYRRGRTFNFKFFNNCNAIASLQFHITRLDAYFDIAEHLNDFNWLRN